MYNDQKNRAYAGMFSDLFPEQTKTVPRIIVWSLILIADIVLAAFLAYHIHLFEFFRGGSGNYIAICIVGAAALFLFWLEGKIFYGIANLFK